MVNSVSSLTKPTQQDRAPLSDLEKGKFYLKRENQNYEIALKFFAKAAEEGCGEGAFNAGFIYYKGKGMKQNFEKAFDYFTQAQKGNFSSATLMKGVMYYYGQGVAKDARRAFNHFLQAIVQGCPSSDVADYFISCMDTEKQLEKEWRSLYKLVKEAVALDYFSQATQGDANAQFHLGKMYFCAHGEKNRMRAFKYFTQAAQKGHANAQLLLGMMYFWGWGIEPSYEQAFKYYTQAADQGVTEAIYRQGRMYYHGEGTPISMESAFNCFSQAAKQGHEDAIQHVFRMYEEGKGVEKDLKKAQAILKCSRLLY